VGSGYDNSALAAYTAGNRPVKIINPKSNPSVELIEDCYMGKRIRRACSVPIRPDMTVEDRLIFCWERGRQLREQDPDLARRAEAGELPKSGWKGGLDRPLVEGVKYGTLNYLAEWQGLRGEDLDIDLTREIELTCSRTGTRVIYTHDVEKFGSA
jgi:hypothetical protein